MRGAFLEGTDLECTKLSGADLRNANLCDADLRFAQLRNADLRDAKFSGTDLDSADLSFAKNLIPQVKCAKNWEKVKYEKDFRAGLGLLPEADK